MISLPELYRLRRLNLKPPRRYLLSLARKGISGAYPLDGQAKRKVWRFRLSELVEAIARTAIPKNGKMCDPTSGSPR